MILIFSESNDSSVSDVIDWIGFLGHSFKRVNTDHLTVGEYSLNLSNSQAKYKSESITSDVGIIWYRGGLGITSYKYPELKKIDLEQKKRIYQSLKMEKQILNDSLCSELLNKEWLSNPLQIDDSDKITTLRFARKFNIDIPESIITNSKEKLLAFYNDNNNKIILKAIHEGVDFSADNDMYMQYTSKVSLNDIQNLTSLFFPSLFQECLDKEFEIRSFFIDENFYSMAIFSQNDKQTKVDFRQYNLEKPNRVAPFILPNPLREKLIALMNEMKLKTGSIDIVKTKDGRYVFLEVNPIGQFGMVSGNCNYNLEKVLATYLIKKDLKNV